MGREEERTKLLSRSMKFHWSKFIKIRVKVHILDDGYVWVQKTWDFAEDLKEEVSGNQIFQARRLPTHAIKLQEIGILPTLILFSPFRRI